MMLLTAQQYMRKNVRMKLLATQPTPNAPSGPRKSVLLRRNLLRNTLLLLDVPRNQGRSVLLLDVGSRKERRSVMIKHKLLSRMLLRNSVPLNHKEPASTSQSWSPSWNRRRNVSMFPRRSVQDPEPTQERWRNQLSRSGAMFLLRNQALPKWLKETTLKIGNW